MVVMVALAMMAFAANSLLCRFALRSDLIDPASFTLIRLLAGTAIFFLVGARSKKRGTSSAEVSWTGALALLIYAWAFAFAYVALGAGTGALLLFGAVQATMLTVGALRGERLNLQQGLGLILSLMGLGIMLVPQFELPSVAQGAMMLAAGIAWGIYSLIGRKSGDAMTAIRLSFGRAALLSLPLTLCFVTHMSFTTAGVLAALASGAIASGLGYLCWYSVLPKLSATSAAIVQLTVPIIAAGVGALIFQETLGARFLIATLAIAVGVVLAAFGARSARMRAARA